MLKITIICLPAVSTASKADIFNIKMQ